MSKTERKQIDPVSALQLIETGTDNEYLKGLACEARAAVAEFVEACVQRDKANAEWASSAERERQEPGPFYQRARAADVRYDAALARVQGGAA